MQSDNFREFFTGTYHSKSKTRWSKLFFLLLQVITSKFLSYYGYLKIPLKKRIIKPTTPGTAVNIHFKRFSAGVFDRSTKLVCEHAWLEIYEIQDDNDDLLSNFDFFEF
jgi:hypothetical protein